MSKRDYFLRYILIIKRLFNNKRATFEEISDYLDMQFELIDKPIKISQRTFQRDLKDIRSLFDIDIKCNNESMYYIAENMNSDFNERMIEAFDIFNTLSGAKVYNKYLLLEKNCLPGTEYLNGLLHAIKNNFIVMIKYQPYYEEEPTERKLIPYAIKEFKGRWYLLAKECTVNSPQSTEQKGPKTFGLDRIKELEITTTHFEYPLTMNPVEYFRDSFGIIRPNDGIAEDIILSFEPLQGKYIKSFPLHPSQEILIDNKKEFRIKLKMFVTFDLIQELLSQGDRVKVIEPISLRKKILEVTKHIEKIYKNR
jgi:predicted DNA-binding transcriptional regulator YafY